MNQLYFSEGRDLDAIIDLYQTKKDTSKSPQPEEKDCISLIRYFEKETSAQKALDVTDWALLHHKFSATLHAKKAQLLIKTNSAELALESLDRAEMFGNCFIEMDLLRIKAYIKLQDFLRGDEVLSNLRLNYQLTAIQLSQTYLFDALIQKEQGLYVQMYQSLKLSLRANPGNQKALRQIWLAVEMSRQYEDGIDFHHELLEEDAYQYLTWFNLAHSYYRSCEYDLAMEAYEFSFVTNETFLPAYLNYVETAIQQEKYYLAINCLETARCHFDLNEEMLLNMGICHSKIHFYDKARNYLFQALRLDNYNPDIYFYIGQSYAKEGRQQNALYYFKKSIELDPTNEDYQLVIAQAYADLNESKKADSHFTLATTLAPYRSELWSAHTTFLLNEKEDLKAYDMVLEATQFTYGADLYYCAAASLFRLNRPNYVQYLEEALIENFELRNVFFSLIPECSRNDAMLIAMIRYYRGELQYQQA